MEKDGVDPHPLLDALEQVTSQGKQFISPKELADGIAAVCTFPRLYVDRFAAAISQTMDRSVQWFQVEEIDTSWAIPLGDLFQTENIPTEANVATLDSFEPIVTAGDGIARFWNAHRQRIPFVLRRGAVRYNSGYAQRPSQP
jgi:hypothetical protein